MFASGATLRWGTEEQPGSGRLAPNSAARLACQFGYFYDGRKCRIDGLCARECSRNFGIQLDYVRALCDFSEVFPANTLSLHGFQGEFRVEGISSSSLAHRFFFQTGPLFAH